MDFTNQNLTRKAYLQNSPRNEQGPNLYLETETSFRQDMITTSFDEQWAKPISRAKARSLSSKEREPKLYRNTASASAMPYGDVYRQIYVENFLLA